jgi:hypothetical protein
MDRISERQLVSLGPVVLLAIVIGCGLALLAR